MGRRKKADLADASYEVPDPGVCVPLVIRQSQELFDHQPTEAIANQHEGAACQLDAVRDERKQILSAICQVHRITVLPMRRCGTIVDAPNRYLRPKIVQPVRPELGWRPR
jgi:hypothetical protein